MYQDKRLYRLANKISETEWSASKEEPAYTGDGAHLQQEWSDLCTRIAKEMQKFHYRAHNHALETFKTLSNKNYVFEQIDLVLARFWAATVDVFDDTDKRQIGEQVKKDTWCDVANKLASACIETKKIAEKRAK